MKPNLNLVAGAMAFGLPMAAAAQTAKPPTTTTTQTTTTTTQTQSVKLKKATAADIKTGATVYDLNGGTVGTVEIVGCRGSCRFDRRRPRQARAVGLRRWRQRADHRDDPRGARRDRQSETQIV